MADPLTRLDYIRAAIDAGLEEHRREINSNTFMDELVITIKFKNGTAHPTKVNVRPNFEHYLTYTQDAVIVTR